MKHEIQMRFTANISNLIATIHSMQVYAKSTIASMKESFNSLKNINFSDLSKNMQKEMLNISKSMNVSLEEIMSKLNSLGNEDGLNLDYSGFNIDDLARETSNAEIEVNKLTSRLKELEAERSKLVSDGSIMNREKIETTTKSIDELKSKIISLKIEISAMKNRSAELGGETENSGKKGNVFFKDMAKNSKSAVGTIAKYTLALIGVRTAFSFLRSCASSQIQENEKLNNSFSAMRSAIGQALLPIISALASTVVSLIPYIVMAINYFNLFINVMFGTHLGITRTIKALNQQKKGINNNRKAVKGLKNELGGLAGFDEITQIKTEDDSGGSDGETNGIDTSKTDTSIIDEANSKLKKLLVPMENVKKFLAEYKPLILGVVGALVLLKLGIAAFKIGEIIGGLSSIKLAMLKILGAIVLISAGVGLLVYGFKQLIDGNILKGLIAIAIGAALIVGGLALIGATALIVPTLIAIAIGVIIALIYRFRGQIWEAIKSIFNEIKGTISAITENIKGYFNGIITFITGVFTGNWKKAWSGIVQAFGSIFKGIVNVVRLPLNLVIDSINWMIKGANAFPKLFGGKSLNIPTIPRVPQLARGGVVNSLTIAEIGEGRYSEAVVPLGNSPQFAEMKQDIASAVSNAIGERGTGTRYIEIDILAGGIRTGKKIIDLIKRTEEAYDID